MFWRSKTPFSPAYTSISTIVATSMAQPRVPWSDVVNLCLTSIVRVRVVLCFLVLLCIIVISSSSMPLKGPSTPPQCWLKLLSQCNIMGGWGRICVIQPPSPALQTFPYKMLVCGGQSAFCLVSASKTQAELNLEHGGRCLLRPVKADQSEQIGLFFEGALKETGTGEGDYRCCSSWQYEKKLCVLWTREHVVDILNRSANLQSRTIWDP